MFKEGDRVKLNVKSIKAHPDYKKLSDEYQTFVKNNSRKTFTVMYDKNKDPEKFVCLVEAPKWLWWVGNLKLIK